MYAFMYQRRTAHHRDGVGIGGGNGSTCVHTAGGTGSTGGTAMMIDSVAATVAWWKRLAPPPNTNKVRVLPHHRAS